MDDASHACVQPGDVLAGKYVVEQVLGAGGMGVVVGAHHVQLDTKVAIKFLLPSMLANREAVARFAREARAAARITSEHVARILDVGTLETGAPYMVMEHLEGGDLAAWLEQRGPLPVEQAIEFVLQACVAVAEAHGLGIIHRDLKPANLFCVRRADGQLSVKVLDFGISKQTAGGRSSRPPPMSITKTSAVMGSPRYMSPEQMQSSKAADAQSDIWALGIILYELLTGRVPFDGETATEIAVKVAMESPPPLSGLRPDVPLRLEAAISKCLEKDRRRRYANVAELALALGEFAPRRARALIERITGTIQAAGLSASALAMPPSPVAPGTLVSLGTIAPFGQTRPIRQATARRKGTLAAAAIATVVASAAAVGFVDRAGTPHAQTSTLALGAAATPGPSPPAPSETGGSAPLVPVSASAAPAVDAMSTLVAGRPPCTLRLARQRHPFRRLQRAPRVATPLSRWTTKAASTLSLSAS